MLKSHDFVVATKVSEPAVSQAVAKFAQAAGVIWWLNLIYSSLKRIKPFLKQ